jgi:hypothetical protein
MMMEAMDYKESIMPESSGALFSLDYQDLQDVR